MAKPTDDERWTISHMLQIEMVPDDYHKIAGDMRKVGGPASFFRTLDSFVAMVCLVHWLEALKRCPSRRC